MRRKTGFTLIELMIVLAVVAVLAALSTSWVRAANRNASVSATASDLAIVLAGMRSYAMSEGQDYLLVVVDAPGSDARACGWWDTSHCAKYFVLASPKPTWTIGGFNPDSPGTEANVVRSEVMPRGIHLDALATYAPPAPFDTVVVNDPDLTATCVGGSKCFAVRFTLRGEAAPVYASGGTTPKIGYAFVLGTDLNVETKGAYRTGLLVSFPGGIVKTTAF
jgi:prepilin-type N-terminal cleavage/methylation domain-containing protein